MIITIEGTKALTAKLKALPHNVVVEVEKTLRKDCEDLCGRSKTICPVDQGDLQGSAESDARIVGFGGVEGVQGYVGYNTEYAVRQHEEMGYHHNSPGQAKYLETPYKAMIGEIIAHVGAAVAAGAKKP